MPMPNIWKIKYARIQLQISYANQIVICLTRIAYIAWQKTASTFLLQVTYCYDKYPDLVSCFYER